MDAIGTSALLTARCLVTRGYAFRRLLLQVGFVDDDTGYYYVFPVDKPDQPVRDMLVDLAVRSQALRETDAAKRQAAVAAAAARASQSARSRLLAPGGAAGAGRGNRVPPASKSNGPVPGAAAANAVVADDRKQRFLHTALTSSQDRMHALSEECDALEAQFGTPHRIEWSVSFWRSKPPAQKIYWHDVLIDEHGRAWKAVSILIPTLRLISLVLFSLTAYHAATVSADTGRAR
mgnify:CR=1 FL=1